MSRFLLMLFFCVVIRPLYHQHLALHYIPAAVASQPSWNWNYPSADKAVQFSIARGQHGVGFVGFMAELFLMHKNVDDSHVEYNANGECRISTRDERISDPTGGRIFGDEVSTSGNIICVFVVAFDTRAGNVIEWYAPDDCDLDGIEFKAMASGCHKVPKDFIYFKKDNLYGLSCFENMPVESEIERGARMKSVGVLAASYFSLYACMEFLEEQVRYLLDNPGHYEKLQEFYNTWKAVLPSHTQENNANDTMHLSSGIHKSLPSPTVMHPVGCFSQFVNFFGDQIFLLWKCMLLKKRILFYSPPPIGVVCYRVYCASCLVLHNIPEITEKIVQPLFYVSVGDVDFLESEISYVACTTEKILEGKPQLYDMYVDNQNVKTEMHNLNKVVTMTSADRDKLNKLNNGFRDLAGNPLNSQRSEEFLFTDYFRELNNHLFRLLLDVSYSQDKQLTSVQIRSIGLDPVADRNFLIQLLDAYGIDAMIMADSPCCA